MEQIRKLKLAGLFGKTSRRSSITVNAFNADLPPGRGWQTERKTRVPAELPTSAAPKEALLAISKMKSRGQSAVSFANDSINGGTFDGRNK
jgi:hypothetical protein